jgi:polygalacturonase
MKHLHLFLTLFAVLACAADGTPRTLNLREAPYASAADGTADDRPALLRAFADARPGDTILLPPGDYRIVLTGGAATVPEGVTLWGHSGKTRLLLDTSGTTSDYREFLRPKSGVTLLGLTVERAADFPGVLFPLHGDAENIAFRACRISGGQSRFPGRYCPALRVGHAPNGVMRGITVRDCFFSDNRSKTPGGGFAVGFANVQNARVENCVMRGYGSEILHVEDRSADILLTGNTLSAGSLLQPNGVIMVLSDSKRVTIANNVIDARANTNRAHLILVTAGGTRFANPSEVSVTSNVLVNGASTRTWYLQGGSGPPPSANLVFPEPAKPE